MHRARTGAPDAGSTLLEVTIAIALLAMLATSVIPAFMSMMVHTAISKQRQVATSLLNEAMEQVRALPFALVANGLDNDEVVASADPRITVSGSSYTFMNGEAIPHGNLDYTQPPLVPHATSRIVEDASYTVAVYPTLFEGSATTLRVTVIVDWNDSYQQGRLDSIQTQSILYSDPTGCISSATHPFAAPCQPFLYASASSGNAAITVTPAPGVIGPAVGAIALTSAQLDLPSTSSTMQVEQITTVSSKTLTGGGTIVTASTATTGAASAALGVDDDPGSASGTSQTQTIAQSGAPITASDGVNSITIAPGSTDTGTATSTIAASATPACHDLSASVLLTGSACASARAQHESTAATLTMNLSTGDASLGAVPLATAAVPAAASRTFTSRHLGPHLSYCTGATGDGCVHAGSRRVLGTIELAGLPQRIIDDGRAPAGWVANRLIRLDDYADVASSERGVNAAAPSVAHASASGSGTPTLTYWNGSGYTTTTIDWGAAPPTIEIPTVSVFDDTVPGGPVEVTIDATVSAGAATTAITGPVGCGTACTAAASIDSPLVADIRYTVTSAGGTLADIVIHVDLGSNIATTSYRAAPGAG